MTTLIKAKYQEIKPALKQKLGVKNDLALPRLVKVVINTGVGKRREKKTVEMTADRLAKITGQKA